MNNPVYSRNSASGSNTVSLSGGGGTRTPMRLRAPHFECGALPVRTTPPALQEAVEIGLSNRGARIRTGDLCVPNAALYRTEPRPDTNNSPQVWWRANNGWGGIRTHAGINPHDFQSCALSRSATHPNSDQTGD